MLPPKYLPGEMGVLIAMAWFVQLQFCSVLFASAATAGDAPAFVHGLWVWKSPTVLGEPHAAEALRDFCKSEGINEVYVSVSERS